MYDTNYTSRLEKLSPVNTIKLLLRENNIVKTSPLYGAVKSLTINSVYTEATCIVVLLPTVQLVYEYEVELRLIGLEENVITIADFSIESLQEKLTQISNRQKYVLVSTYALLNCKFPSKKKVKQNSLLIDIGSDVNYSGLVEYFNLFNYQKNKFVEAPGEFAQRGAIIDFWSFSEGFPVRIEFDGDFIESIRSFDPESQRSTGRIISTSLAPSFHEAADFDDSASSDIFNYLESPTVFASMYELNNLRNEKIDIYKKEEKVKEHAVYDDSMYDDTFPEVEKVSDEVLLITASQEENHFVEKLFSKECVKWVVEEEIEFSDDRINLELLEIPSINSNYKFLSSLIIQYSKEEFKIYFAAENEIQTKRLTDLLSNYNEELQQLMDSGQLKVITFPVREGFISKSDKLLLLSDYQVFNKPFRTKIPTVKKAKRSRTKEFSSISLGDYVVHEEFGIGKYAGLEAIKIGDVEQESMKLLYSDGDVVYVNLNYLHLVKRYSAKDGLVPQLSTLGTKDWANTKKKTKRKIKEAARELIQLYAKRKSTPGFAFGEDSVWQRELEASFIYEDTPDQARASEEVKSDLEAANPMDRLVCGDVGFGKTEVAVRAAFKVIQEGKQVAVLVPTTILAEQHFNTFSDRLRQFPVKVSVLSRFQSKTNQAEIVKQLSAGNIDVIVGTHRLLSKDVQFKDIGLLIIDEEHRFGVMAKEKLRGIKHNVDTLTLTATPIPRTLNLSLLGARDLSIIATAPSNRQPIYTKIEIFDVNKIKQWVNSELNRNGQVYIVHDRVHSIDKFAGYLHKYMPELKFAIAHGQMKASSLEKVFHDFLNRKFDVLISTKIIESGLDIPNVNTIIINRADRFGLAELHQLRGRVGRSDRQAYAYFLVPSLNALNKKTLKRLQAIEEYTELGAGFNLSMRDLEIRGAGNLLGTEQSGFINDVGFDLYIKLINEAVEELKMDEFKDLFKDIAPAQMKTDPTIDTYFEIGIPSAYMPDQADRLGFYSTLYSIKTIKDLEDIKEEMIDRFGPLPVLVTRLLSAAALKYFSSFALFQRVIIQRKNIIIILPKAANEDYYKYKFSVLLKYIMEEHKETVKFNQQKDIMKLVIQNNFETPETLLSFLIDFTEEVEKIINPGRKEFIHADKN